MSQETLKSLDGSESEAAKRERDAEELRSLANTIGEKVEEIKAILAEYKRQPRWLDGLEIAIGNGPCSLEVSIFETADLIESASKYTLKYIETEDGEIVSEGQVETGLKPPHPRHYTFSSIEKAKDMLSSIAFEGELSLDGTMKTFQDGGSRVTRVRYYISKTL